MLGTGCPDWVCPNPVYRALRLPGSTRAPGMFSSTLVHTYKKMSLSLSLSLCTVYLLERQTDTETEQQKDRRQTLVRT